MSTSLRKLAIRLACIHSEDRAWILGQLAPTERQQVNELLQEIDMLGLAADPAIVHAVMNEMEQGTPSFAQVAERLDGNARPFWLGLALQALSEASRQGYLYGDASPALHRWHKEFADQTLPPALLQQLRIQLEVPDGNHEHI